MSCTFGELSCRPSLYTVNARLGLPLCYSRTSVSRRWLTSWESERLVVLQSGPPFSHSYLLQFDWLQRKNRPQITLSRLERVISASVVFGGGDYCLDLSSLLHVMFIFLLTPADINVFWICAENWLASWFVVMWFGTALNAVAYRPECYIMSTWPVSRVSGHILQYNVLLEYW